MTSWKLTGIPFHNHRKATQDKEQSVIYTLEYRLFLKHVLPGANINLQTVHSILIKIKKLELLFSQTQISEIRMLCCQTTDLWGAT